MALRKFIIERNIPKVGSFDAKQLSDELPRNVDHRDKAEIDLSRFAH